MTTDAETTAIVVASPLDLIESFDDQQIITALQGATDGAVQTWCYQFKQDGQPIIGMSIDGVQEAAREMARRGDVIDQEWVRMDRETEREAYFTGKAVRFAVSPNGQRVQMDSAIRSKRIEKFTKLREPRFVDGVKVTEVPNRYWYEVGVAKAARNAVEALLPEGIKNWMMETAKKGGNIRDVSKDREQTPETRRAQQQPRAQAPAPKPTDESAALQAQILDDIKRARAEFGDGFGAWAQLIRDAFPAAFANGKPAFPALDAEALTALAARVRADVGAVPEAQEMAL